VKARPKRSRSSWCATIMRTATKPHHVRRPHQRPSRSVIRPSMNPTVSGLVNGHARKSGRAVARLMISRRSKPAVASLNDWGAGTISAGTGTIAIW